MTMMTTTTGGGLDKPGLEEERCNVDAPCKAGDDRNVSIAA
jgi:hypothetical protein